MRYRIYFALTLATTVQKLILGKWGPAQRGGASAP